MGKGSSKNNVKYDVLLRSFLAPDAYSETILGNTAKLNDVPYQIPEGMTEAQAMMVVLGAMLDEEVLFNATSLSSSANLGHIDWMQTFLIRDYTDDEKRGILYSDAMLEGRKKAAQALREFAEGNHEKVNQMLARAGNAINSAFAGGENDVTDDKLWSSISAAMRLMQEAKGNPEFDKAMNPDASIMHDNAVLDKEMDRYHEIEDLIADDKLPEDKRKELILEGMVHSAIAYEYMRTAVLPDEIADWSTGDMAYDNEFMSYKAKQDFIKKYTGLYNETHPSAFHAMLRTEEGRKQLYAKYEEAIKGSEKYEEAIKENKLPYVMQSFISMKFDDYLSPEERQKLDKKWKQESVNAKQEYRDLYYKQFSNRSEAVMEDLKKAAETNGIKGLNIIGFDFLKGNNPKKKPHKFADHILHQNDIFVFDDDMDSVYRMYTLDGKNYRVQKLDSMPYYPADTEVNKIARYAEAMLPVLKSMKNALADVPPEHQDIAEDLTAVNDILKAGLYNNNSKANDADTEKKITELRAKVESAAQTANQRDLTWLNNLGETLGQIATALNNAKEKINSDQKYVDESMALAAKPQYREKALETLIAANRSTNVKTPWSRDTEARANLKNYLSAINSKLEGNSELSEKFAEYIRSLNVINMITDLLYKRDENGNYPKFAERDRVVCLKAYRNALIQSAKLDEELKQNPALVDLSVMVKSIHKLLKNDEDCMTKLSADDKMSLAEAIDQAQNIRIDAKGKDFSRVGNISNTRIAMSIANNTREIKGFFTEDKKFAFTSNEAQKMKAIAEVHLKNDPDLKKIIHAGIDKMFAEETFEGLFSMFNRIFEVMDEHPELVSAESRKKIEKLESDRSKHGTHDIPLLRDLDQAIIAVENVMMQYKFTVDAVQGSSITGRNVAMSRVAGLLGVPNIIANSRPMEIINDSGELVHGVFMENAEGRDRDSLMPDDVKNINEKSGDNPSLLKDLADIQMLDFICANVDRHQNNIFYKFNDDMSQVIGIQGIDNDYSFGTRHPIKEERMTSAQINFEDINVVSKSMAEKILAMDEAMLKASLQGTGLMPAEMDAAAARLNMVKDAINAKTIEMIPDENWKDYTLETLAQKSEGENMFRRLHGQITDIEAIAQKNLGKKKRTEEKALKEQAEGQPEKKAFHFEKVHSLDSLTKDAALIEGYAKCIADSQKKIVGSGSDEFRNLATAIDEYSAALTSIDASIKENKTELKSQDYLMAQAKLEKLGLLANQYLDTKQGVKLNANGKERYAIAESIKAFTQQRIPEFKDAMHRRDEIGLEDFNAKMKAQAEQLASGKQL